MTTTLSPTPAPASPAMTSTPLYRLTVEQYHAMLKAGILVEGEKCELIEGILVQKMTRGRPHYLTIVRLSHQLSSALPNGWHVESENAITTEDSEPEPDAAVIRGAVEDYPTEHPKGSDVGLVIEVSDSTLSYDRTDKKRIYARAGIPVYWIVNLRERTIEVYTDPSGSAEAPDYRARQVYTPGESVPVTLDSVPGTSVPVLDILV